MLTHIAYEIALLRAEEIRHDAQHHNRGARLPAARHGRGSPRRPLLARHRSPAPAT